MLRLEGSRAQGSTGLGASGVPVHWRPCTATLWAQLRASKNSAGETGKNWADLEASGVGRAAWGPVGREQKFGQTSGSRARPGPWGTLTRSKMGTVGLSACPAQSGAGQQPVGGMACGSQSPRAAPSMAQPEGDPVPCPRQTPIVVQHVVPAPPAWPRPPGLGSADRLRSPDAPAWPSEERAGGGQEVEGWGRAAPDGTPGL